MANRSATSLDRSKMSTPEAPGVEYFWSIELNADNRSHTWTAKDDELEDDDEDFFNHMLFLKMGVLVEGAVPGEINIVTLESTDVCNQVQKGAILHLAQGVNGMSQLDISLNGKVGGTFNLSSGSGPVHISGNYLIEYPKNESLDNTQTETEVSTDEEEGDEERDTDEDEDETAVASKGKKVPKRKGTPKSNKGKQKAKMEVDDNEDEEEDEDEDEEEDDEDEDFEEEKEKSRKGKKLVGVNKDMSKKTGKGKAAPEAAKKGKKPKK